MLRWIAALGLIGLSFAPSSLAQEPKPASGSDYLEHVKPLLKRCVACHGDLRQQGGLRLDYSGGLRAGGESGPLYTVGRAAESLLIERVSATDDTRMPPEGEPLTGEQIAGLARWIDSGARLPEEPRPADPRDHWSFRTPVRPVVPTASGVENPIDAFIQTAQRERGLQPLGAVDRGTLLRRVTLDLTGLPPSPEEMQAFLADDRPDAYHRVVDKLLRSPGHAERWARHWMDVWRYSDWAGYGKEIRDSQPHIWRWRDWIVESLADDKPYDRMIVEMLAGDELAPGDPQVLRATGFLVRNYNKFSRTAWMDNTIEHTGKAFLALTFNCARCHDHMYDPIAQREYYQLRAFFEPYQVRIDRLPGESDTLKQGLARVFDQDINAPTYFLHRGDERNADKSASLPATIPALFTQGSKIDPVTLPTAAFYPGSQPFVRQEALAEAERDRDAAHTGLKLPLSASEDERTLADLVFQAAEAKLAAVQAVLSADDAKLSVPPAENAKSLAEAATAAQRRHAALKARADLLAARLEWFDTQEQGATTPETAAAPIAAAEKKHAAAFAARDTTEKALQAAASPQYTALTPTYPATSSGRRLALARFIASRDNPLTARVAVNHIWLRHFGTPLVPTVFDFGRNGKAPTHPELLDWLASEFLDSGWSMRHLHRLIVTSDAYRRQSSFTGDQHVNERQDPDNRFLWRMNTRRMEAEVVRDSVLFVSGGLDATLGGPDIEHAQGLTSPRRSLYFQSAREKQMMFLTLFDVANVTECYRRYESIVPQQALALANSPLSLEAARRLAGTLRDEIGRDSLDPGQFVRRSFERILSRAPSERELQTCLEFLTSQAELFQTPATLTTLTGSGAAPRIAPSADPAQRARENLVHVLLNHHDFVNIR